MFWSSSPFGQVSSGPDFGASDIEDSFGLLHRLRKMQDVNPMNLSNLLNDSSIVAGDNENSTPSSSPRVQYGASQYQPTLAYRPAQHGNYAMPSSPTSDSAPSPQFQHIRLPGLSSFHGLPPSPPLMDENREFMTGLPEQYGITFSSLTHVNLTQPLRLPSLRHLGGPTYLPREMQLPDRLHLDMSYGAHRGLSRSPVSRHNSYDRHERYLHSVRQSTTGNRRLSRSTSQRMPKVKRRGMPSNVKYTAEQVDFCRYMKEDCNVKWEEVLKQFQVQFPSETRDSNQCLTSRYYRDNMLPCVDDDWRLIEVHGKIKREPAKVRDRSADRFKDAPHKLVEKHPRRALAYAWVSKEEKERALSILEQDEVEAKMGRLSVQARWRRVILEAEFREKK